MFKRAVRKVVAVGLVLCIAAGSMLATPPAPVFGYEYANVEPFGGHRPEEEYD